MKRSSALLLLCSMSSVGCAPIAKHPVSFDYPSSCPQSFSSAERYPVELEGSYRLKFEDAKHTAVFDAFVEIHNEEDGSSAVLAVLSPMGTRILLSTAKDGKLESEVSPLSDFPAEPADIWRMFELAALAESELSKQLGTCGLTITETNEPAGRFVKHADDLLLRIYSVEPDAGNPTILAVSFLGGFTVTLTRLDPVTEDRSKSVNTPR